jgi:hypothetical protein
MIFFEFGIVLAARMTEGRGTHAITQTTHSTPTHVCVASQRGCRCSVFEHFPESTRSLSGWDTGFQKENATTIKSRTLFGHHHEVCWST